MLYKHPVNELLLIFQSMYFFFKICKNSFDDFSSRSYFTCGSQVDSKEEVLHNESDSNSAAAEKKKNYILYLKF